MKNNAEQGNNGKSLFRIAYVARGVAEAEQVMRILDRNKVDCRTSDVPNIILQIIVPFYRIRILVPEKDEEKAKTVIDKWRTDTVTIAEAADRDFRHTLMLSIPVAVLCLTAMILTHSRMSAGLFFSILAVYPVSLVIISRFVKSGRG